MNTHGGLVAGTRSLDSGADLLEKDEISIDDSTVYVSKTREDRKKTVKIKIPKDKKLAADGSFLALLRFFPFHTDTEWTMFMVDFSGSTVTLTVRQAGEERIVVPGGEFRCFRLEATVHIPILKPTLTYWLAADEPHFLVKNIGKRGPFTPAYVTTLVAKESKRINSD
jgi:hypothetical protein